MHPAEIKQILESFVVIVDTREQETSASKRRYKQISTDIHRAKLDYGDYTFNFKINGEWFHDESLPIFPSVVIERKMSIDELASCFTVFRKRFEAEMIRCQEHGSKMYLLIEGLTYESIYDHLYRSKFEPKAFIASLIAWQARYNLHIVTCRQETSGKLIREILYRELKEMCERGDIDGGGKEVLLDQTEN